MIFTLQRDKYRGLGQAAGLSPLEQAFLAAPEKPSFDEDQAVELLADSIRERSCRFRFKRPLGGEFEHARDHAVNCLEMGEPHPRKVRDWLGNCLKCMDCLLLVYIRDVLKANVPVRDAERARGGNPAERDLYFAYMALTDEDLKRVGRSFNRLYDQRNSLEHHQVVGVAGRREIRHVPHQRLQQTYHTARGQVRDSLDVMVPRYRDAFPNDRTD